MASLVVSKEEQEQEERCKRKMKALNSLGKEDKRKTYGRELEKKRKKKKKKKPTMLQSMEWISWVNEE